MSPSLGPKFSLLGSIDLIEKVIDCVLPVFPTFSKPAPHLLGSPFRFLIFLFSVVCSVVSVLRSSAILSMVFTANLFFCRRRH